MSHYRIVRLSRVLLVVLFLMLLLQILVPVPVAHASTLIVTNLNNSGAGSLRWAMNQANTLGGSNTIVFAISGTINLQWSLPFVLHDLNINGPSGGITINGHGSQVFVVTPVATLSLTNMTITNGYTSATWGGGAIYNDGGTVNLTNCTLTGNSADSQGGAIFNNNGHVTLINSTLSNNTAMTSHGDLFAAGGGVYNLGGLYVYNSTFFNNAAAAGGGIFIDGGYGDVVNSTFYANTAVTSAGGSGGAIYINHYGLLVMYNSTVSGNAATYSAGGIYKDTGVADLWNTIIANNNSGGNCFGAISDSGGNLRYPLTDSSCVGTFGDPRLGPLQNNGGSTMTLALLSGSAAIDNPNCSTYYTTDQRDMPRPQNGVCDIGAYERGSPVSLTAVAGDAQAVRTNMPFPVPLQGQVTDAIGGPLDSISVSFNGPLSGAGITSGDTVSTNNQGMASFAATANGSPGGPYVVIANAGGLTANFHLTNLRALFLPLIRK